MKIDEIPIPSTFPELKTTLAAFQESFAQEMLHTRNQDLPKRIETELSSISKLARSLSNENKMRAAVGVVTLRRIGYNNFQDLARIFDNLIPQSSLEFAKFTSWCASQLIHHPDSEESEYATLLLNRSLTWIWNTGRHSRNAAAVSLIGAIAKNAGHVVVAALPRLQNALFRVTCASSEVIVMTSECLERLISAIFKYARGVVASFYTFMVDFCCKILEFGSENLKYAGFVFFRKTMRGNRNYFVPSFSDYFTLFKRVMLSTRSRRVLAAGYLTTIYLVEVDTQAFEETVLKFVSEYTEELFIDFPGEVVEGLCVLIRRIPARMYKKVRKMMRICARLSETSDQVFQLVETLASTYKETILEFNKDMMVLLIHKPMDSSYVRSFTTICRDNSRLWFVEMFTDRILAELDTFKTPEVLILLSQLSENGITRHGEVLEKLISCVSKVPVTLRRSFPRAILHIASFNDNQSRKRAMDILLQWAIFDPSPAVRVEILHLFSEMMTRELADENYMRFYSTYAKDENQTVRRIAFEILGKVLAWNPMGVSSIARNTLCDYFFVFQNDSCIRQRAMYVSTLPALIKAASQIISAYSKTLMEIAINVLKDYCVKKKRTNFLEETADVDILVGIIDSITVLSTINPPQVTPFANDVVPLMPKYLKEYSSRSLILSIFRFFETALTAPTGSVVYRFHTPMIMTSCTECLATTKSRKIRIAVLRVIGAIGVLEVHKLGSPRLCKAPKDIDEKLIREFFQPSRDIEDEIDDALLFVDETVEEYNAKIATKALLKVLANESLKEFYIEAIHAIIEIVTDVNILGYFDLFSTRFVTLLETCDSKDLREYLACLVEFIKRGRSEISPYCERIAKLVQAKFSNELCDILCDVLVALIDVIGVSVGRYADGMVSMLLSHLEAAEEPESVKIMSVFNQLFKYWNELHGVVLPRICRLIRWNSTIPVKIAGFRLLDELVQTCDVFPHIGVIMRCVKLGFESTNETLQMEALNIVKSLVKTQGKLFLDIMDPVMKYMEQRQIISIDLRQLISRVQITKQNSFQPCFPVKEEISAPDNLPYFQFRESVITSKTNPQSHSNNNMDEWIHAFKLSTIANAPSPHIRKCASLASSHIPLSVDLFRPAFLSCWKEMSDLGRQQISDFIRQLICSTEITNTTAHEVIELATFMMKVGFPLNISIDDMISASVQHGDVGIAMKMIFDSGRSDEQTLAILMEIYTQSGNWANALWVWNQNIPQQSSETVLRKMRMWDKLETYYATRYQTDKKAFKGLIESFNSLGKWIEILEYFPTFETKLTRMEQAEVSEFFASSAFYLGRWDILDYTVKYTSSSSFKGIMLSGINFLHKRDFTQAEEMIDRGFDLIASQPIMFWAEDQRIHKEVMISCQQLIEMEEMISWLKDKTGRKMIEDIWLNRMKTVPRDFAIWLRIISNRVRITERFETDMIQMFSLESQALGAKLHARTFEALGKDFAFDNSSDDLERLCHVITLWVCGKRQEAAEKVFVLAESATTLKSLCKYCYASWITTLDNSLGNLQSAYAALKPCIDDMDYATLITPVITERPKAKDSQLPNLRMKSLFIDLPHFEMLRMWAEVNTDLALRSATGSAEYVKNAISALYVCVHVIPILPDVVQLLGLFFENARDVFDDSNALITTLDPKLLLRAAPQLEVQLSHEIPEVAQFVHELLFDLLQEHFHGLIFSIIVTTYSKNVERAKRAKDILDEFRSTNPVAYEEVSLIRTSMLRAAVTWTEKLHQQASHAFDCVSDMKLDYAKMIIDSLVKLIESPKCDMHHDVLDRYKEELQQLKLFASEWNTDNSFISELHEFCWALKHRTNQDMQRMRTLRLSSISHDLAQKTDFVLAVPGTYKPFKPITRISYFVGQFSVYMSKQQPKDIVVIGTDGNFYQYLLKGHEDLRLDERVMQFFSVINSLLKQNSVFKGHVIEAMCVIPMSVFHGLVQWVPGTDTLRAVIEQYRKIRHRNPFEEYRMCQTMSSKHTNMLTAVQRLQIIEKIFRDVPDTDIADFFWIKATSSEAWLNQINTFTVTSALTSLSGYIIGLGDRHPSNILIDRTTGKVIHIDFGDCFEKAARRKILPEVVPFRLTRMMVKAMGVTGYHGCFTTTFNNLSYLLRENQRSLLLILSIFAHEPVARVDKALEKVTDKLTGRDLGTEYSLSVESQTDKLIEMATNHYNYARMYSGWCPFW